MSNEELAVLIQQGDKAKENDLWESVKDFIAQQARKYYKNGQQDRASVEVDDFIQAGYFAMIKAVRDYDQESGYSFLTFLSYRLKTEFNIVGSNRTHADKMDPALHATSLDAPIDPNLEGENLTLHDVIRDPADIIADTEERLYYEQLHNDIEKALNTIPEDSADVIRREYWQGQNSEEIAAAQGCTCNQIRTKKAKAIRELRKPSKGLRKYEELNYFHHVGLSKFQRTGISATEQLALQAIEDELQKAYAILKESTNR